MASINPRAKRLTQNIHRQYTKDAFNKLVIRAVILGAKVHAELIPDQRNVQ
jgi:hypothetical protein